MNQPIILHCNYVEQGQSVDQMCRLAKRWGYDGIEFRRRPGAMTVDQYLDAIAAACQREGLEHVLFGGPGPNLMQDDADERKRELDAAIDFYRKAARRFDLSVVNVMAGPLMDPSIPGQYEKHGSAIATDAHWQQATEGFQVLGDLAAELKFRMAFEVHMNYLHDLPASARKLVEMIDRPAVGINLDYGNVQLFADPPSLEEAIACCGDRTYLVHLKNSVLVRGLPPHSPVNCGLADGNINNRAFLRLLQQQGYTGPIVLEAPRPGDREWYAQQDLAYIQSVMQDLAAEQA